MVSGMTRSFLLALGLLTLAPMTLFRSVRWGMAAMLPVLGTVVVVYGALGWLGIDVDMPVAAPSSLELGIGVDFAIDLRQPLPIPVVRPGDRRAAVAVFMEEPGRALMRNALVIAGGFLRLFLADLVPYVVVVSGLLLAGIVDWCSAGWPR